MLSLRARFGSLDAWACLSDGCKARSEPAIVTPYSKAVAYDSYLVLEDGVPDGHNGSVFYRKTTASVPAIFEGSRSPLYK